VKLLGPKSETLNNLQLELLADEEPGATLDEVEAETKRKPLTVAPPQVRKPHPERKPLPENLPRVEEIVRCADPTCRQCGAETTIIGYDESEQVDVEPERYFVWVIKREKRPKAGPKVAAILSVVESCRRLQVPLNQHLLDVLPGLDGRMLSQVSRLTPANWSAWA
jgi:hypothetical protein